VKLSVWLAIACDVDGILWYPMSVGGGLLEWSPDSADDCRPSDNLANAGGSHEILTTDRYDAAKKACNESKLITPILESLDFVKTYASRAFGTDYPDPYGEFGYPAVQLDTLAFDGWYNQMYRWIERIQTWAPSTFAPDCTVATWQSEPEADSYVQVSRFRSKSVQSDAEDYWFLIVNRRVLPGENRKIRLTIETDTINICYPYWADYYLGDSSVVCETPYRSQCYAKRYLDVKLRPAEAELVHFFRGEFGCDTSYYHIRQLTAIRENEHAVRLNWEAVDTTDQGLPFEADTFFVCGSPRITGPFSPIGFSTSNAYVDSAFATLSNYFYTVQACGTIHARPSGSPINEPKKPTKSKVAATRVVSKSE
jgi:hypothetical protein